VPDSGSDKPNLAEFLLINIPLIPYDSNDREAKTDAAIV
jgi:hypothetical protein